MEMTGPTSAGPLAGMVVLDLTQILAGPMCTMVLADMGADVIKIEKPQGGDDNRRMGPPFVKDWSAGFLAVNRNKRSLALDLRSEEGRGVFRRLVEDADAVVENFRPGSFTAQFRDSAAQGRPATAGGSTSVAQGVSGLMSITGHPDMPPAKVGVPITDLTAGLYGANGVMAAYIHALKTGQGQMVDTSLMEAGVAYTVWESSVYFAEGEIPGPLGSAHRVSAPYQALRTRDGYLNLGAATQPTWEQLCRAIGREDLMDDDRFRNPWDRKARERELADLLEETFSTQDTEQWLELLDNAGVVAGPIYNMEQVYRDPQVLAREMLVDTEDPELGTIHNIGVPVKLSATPGRIRRRAPALGEHSREILLEHGFSQEEVDNLLEDGVVLGNQGSGVRR
ncbi:Succinate--hydroxymethylglutarate CoA-transferase [Geodia barretti]|uniref:Succinate--hydroxymethylglutarate CoA-transferase n=1 Tax=Geodia barretti TaxID=519541 RepID=A0AA35SD44_GEOBA|nr:Succinate--hydroxymethylglutarate CoA-transferase [Geodia barretti]